MNEKEKLKKLFSELESCGFERVKGDGTAVVFFPSKSKKPYDIYNFSLRVSYFDEDRFNFELHVYMERWVVNLERFIKDLKKYNEKAAEVILYHLDLFV